MSNCSSFSTSFSSSFFFSLQFMITIGPQQIDWNNSLMGRRRNRCKLVQALPARVIILGSQPNQWKYSIRFIPWIGIDTGSNQPWTQQINGKSSFLALQNAIISREPIIRFTLALQIGLVLGVLLFINHSKSLRTSAASTIYVFSSSEILLFSSILFLCELYV